jgi:hypothetical protein
MLADRSDFRVDCGGGRARIGFQANLAGIAPECAVDEGGGHAGDVVGCFGVGESLVGGFLLQAFGVGELAEASGGGLEEGEVLVGWKVGKG